MSRERIITLLAATILAVPAIAADAPGYFKVPGTETTMQIYGYAGLDAVYDIQGTGTATSGVWTGEAPKNQWDMSARARVGITTTTASKLGDVIVKVEWDPTSAGLRHAYASIGNLLVGQTTTIWCIPGCNNLGSVYGDNVNTERMPQIRYTFPISKQLTIALALEQPSASTVANNATPDPWDHWSNTWTKPNHTFPGVITASVAYADTWGEIGGRLLAQRYTHWSNDDAPMGKHQFSKTGIGYRVYGVANIGKDNLTLSLTSGEGLGQYGTDDGWLDYEHAPYNHIYLYKTLGVTAQYMHVWSDTISSNIGFSQLKAKKVSEDGHQWYGYNGDIKTVSSAFVNTYVQITPQAKFGAEYAYGRAKAWGPNNNPYTDAVETGNTVGKESRILMRLEVSFF